MKIFDTIHRFTQSLSGSEKQGPEVDATAKLLRRLCVSCASCGSANLAEHRYGRIASVVAEENSKAVLRALELVQHHDWPALAQLQDFNADKTCIVVYGLVCQKAGEVLVVRDTVDIHESVSILMREPFGEDELGLVRSVMLYDKAM